MGCAALSRECRVTKEELEASLTQIVYEYVQGFGLEESGCLVISRIRRLFLGFRILNVAGSMEAYMEILKG
jgi:hypothetical protein